MSYSQYYDEYYPPEQEHTEHEVVTSVSGTEFVSLNSPMACCECGLDTNYIELATMNFEAKALCCLCSRRYD